MKVKPKLQKLKLLVTASQDDFDRSQKCNPTDSFDLICVL